MNEIFWCRARRSSPGLGTRLFDVVVVGSVDWKESWWVWFDVAEWKWPLWCCGTDDALDLGSVVEEERSFACERGFRDDSSILYRERTVDEEWAFVVADSIEGKTERVRDPEKATMSKTFFRAIRRGWCGTSSSGWGCSTTKTKSIHVLTPRTTNLHVRQPSFGFFPLRNFCFRIVKVGFA